MLKKLFKLATVLGLLTASHLAYVRTFDLVVGRLRAARHVDPLEFAVHDSDSKRLVRETAERVFGRDSWTNSDDLLRYVSQEKGIILFAAEFSRPVESGGVKFDGRRIEVKPAALVLGSPKKGGSTRTMTSESATIDFDKPLGLSTRPGEPSPSVKFARLERNVMIRDDRGTPDDPKDDLIIGPLTDVEYADDGVAPLIRTDSDVVVVDRNLRVTGTGLEIQLRPKLDPNAPGGRASGFDGAQQLTLFKNVRTTFLDVGRTGMLPDLEATKAGAAEKPAAAPAEPIPLDVQSDGPLIVALPHAPAAPPVGPPQPSDPTYVEFRNNVVVRRGKLGELPDQLTCDTLHLTLLPGEKKPAPAAVAKGDGEKEQGDAFGGLTLRRVKASGHAVWLQMPAQGVKILCVELLHYKEPASGKNTTVFNGGGPKKLWLEKRDLAAAAPGAGPGKLQSITHVWCSDATLTDDGDPNRAALVANGPGLLETRPALGADEPPRDVPPARTAAWREQLWVQNEAVEAGRVPGRVLVLKGTPKVEDRAQGASLEAADRIVVWLNPDEKKTLTQDGREVVPASYVEPDPAAPQAAQAQSQALPSIRRLLAVKDVHLVDAMRDLRLRDRLDVDFEAGTVDASPAPGTSPAPAAKPAPAPAVNAEDAPDLTPVPAQGADASKAKPAGPKMSARAERAQAVVIVGARPAAAGTAPAQPAAGAAAAKANEPAYELRDVELRGSVQLHQDPGEGKTVGTDATGEVLVLRNEAKGQVVFDLYHHDQHSAKGRAIDPKQAPKARVSTEEMTIEADTIGVDQKADQAWAYGEGKLTQLTDRSLFTDRNAEGLDAAAAEAEAKAKAEGAAPKVRRRGGKTLSNKVPITVTWTKLMTFEGVSRDPLKRPAAKIKFLGRAHAQMEDSLLHGEDSITLYTDRPIPLVDAGKLTGKAEPKADAEAGAEPEPKADLAMIEVVGTPKARAVAITRKVHPEFPVLISQQRMEAGSLLYERRSGTFRAPGPGEVFLYDRKGDPTKEAAPTLDPAAVAVRPASFRPGEDDAPAGDEPGDRVAANPDAPRRAAAPKFPPLVLTQIKFVREMSGRFGTGVGDDVDDQRWAEFFGAVETARGNVANESVRFDYDRLPADAAFLTSEMFRVINEPPPPGAAKTSGGRNFLKAWDNAYVRARDTALQADIITYDSLNDLVYAYGHEGRMVQVVQQAGVGQSGSPGQAASVLFNPRDGSVKVSDPRSFQLIDTRTGTRPGVIKPSQMIPKEAPKRPKPFRPKTNPVERKGFTGR